MGASNSCQSPCECKCPDSGSRNGHDPKQSYYYHHGTSADENEVYDYDYAESFKNTPLVKRAYANKKDITKKLIRIKKKI